MRRSEPFTGPSLSTWSLASSIHHPCESHKAFGGVSEVDTGVVDRTGLCLIRWRCTAIAIESRLLFANDANKAWVGGLLLLCCCRRDILCKLTSLE
jgi:hypothetical protein